ncbi:MAG: RHS repeat-associated core domain-containing protein, partial [Bacilli bacterium]|nr:RHS repeat-associated core domain-containing protein [Bacilli bacterium]
LYYCNARYYNPDIYEWLTPDDIGYLDIESVNGLNLYCYCENNPIMYADPSGHSWKSFWDGIGDWFSDNWVKLAIGAGAIALGILTMGAATLISGAGMAVALSVMGSAAVSSLVQVGISTAISASIGLVVGGITAGSLKGAIDGMLNGVADGFMWGGIFAGAGQMFGGAMKITRTLAPKFNGVQIGKVKLWSPNAVTNKNIGGTLIKFGRFNRIDSEIGNMIHIHLKLLGQTIDHFPIGMIVGGVIGGF